MILHLAMSLVLLCLGSSPRGAGALEFKYQSFGQRVREAGVVFAGTVSGLDSLGGESGPVLRVTFRDVQYAKGGPLPDGRTRLTIRGGGGLVYSEMPSFVRDRRYIVLAAADMGSPENWFMPIPKRGLFSVGIDSSLGSGGSPKLPVVAFSEHPIARVEGDDLVLASKDVTDEDYDRRMSEKAFLRAIRSLLKER